MTFTTALTRGLARTLPGIVAAAVATLLAAAAQAQPATPQSLPVAATTGTEAPIAAAEPRYSAENIARAFNFMDGNRDGKISRTEAAGFRGVARHFDQADTNKDNALSHEEFESALNHGKSP